MNAPSDLIRSLSEEGKAQASYTGQRLSDWPKVWLPNRVLVSEAQRTQETYQSLCGSWSALNEISPNLLKALYLASADQWCDELSRDPDSRVVLCIGHNPGLSDLIVQLSGQWVTLEVGEAIGLCIKRQVSWRDAVQGNWELRGRIRPQSHLV